VEKLTTSDLYLLGSLVVYTFAQVPARVLLEKHLEREHRPLIWGDSFADVLPYLQDAHGNLLAEFRTHLPFAGPRADALVALVSQLSNPDPSARGDQLSASHAKARLLLNRHISLLNRLAREAELGTLTDETAIKSA
jgi:hypothetical protein